MMKLYTFISATIAAYLLLQFYVIPVADQKWAANEGFQKLGKAGVLAECKAARTFVQAALVTYLLMLMTILVASLFVDEHATSGYIDAVEKAEALKESVAKFNESVWGPIEFGLAAFALMALHYRRQKQDLIERAHGAVQLEAVRLRQQLEQGQWPDMPPSVEMLNAESQLNNLYSLRGVLRGQPPSKQLKSKLDALDLAIQTVKRNIFELDFLRRLNFASPPIELTEDARSRWWPRIATLLTSKSFAADTSLVSKSCAQLGSALLFVSVLGVSGFMVDDALAHRIDSLWNLEVKLNAEQAKKSWEEQVTPQAKSAPAVLSSSDQVAVNHLARVMASDVMRTMLNPIQHRRGQNFALRSEFVREEIISTAQISESSKPTGGFVAANLDDEERPIVGLVQAALEANAPADKQQAWLAAKIEEQVVRPPDSTVYRLSRLVLMQSAWPANADFDHGGSLLAAQPRALREEAWLEAYSLAREAIASARWHSSASAITNCALEVCHG